MNVRGARSSRPRVGPVRMALVVAVALGSLVVVLRRAEVATDLSRSTPARNGSRLGPVPTLRLLYRELDSVTVAVVGRRSRSHPIALGTVLGPVHLVVAATAPDDAGYRRLPPLGSLPPGWANMCGEGSCSRNLAARTAVADYRRAAVVLPESASSIRPRLRLPDGRVVLGERLAVSADLRLALVVVPFDDGRPPRDDRDNEPGERPPTLSWETQSPAGGRPSSRWGAARIAATSNLTANFSVLRFRLAAPSADRVLVDLDTPAEPPLSGGPVGRVSGRPALVGVVSGRRRGEVEMVSTRALAEWSGAVLRLLSESSGPTPAIGLGISGAGGRNIVSASRGPAQRAGIRPNDELVAADGHPVDGMDALKVLVRGKAVGDRVRLQVLRDGLIVNASVEIVSSGSIR